MLKLYTFNISHFAEKARWTLDYEGLPYEEWPAMPAELSDFEASLGGRPTWNHVLRMYRDYRAPNRAHDA